MPRFHQSARSGKERALGEPDRLAPRSPIRAPRSPTSRSRAERGALRGPGAQVRRRSTARVGVRTRNANDAARPGMSIERHRRPGEPDPGRGRCSIEASTHTSMTPERRGGREIGAHPSPHSLSAAAPQPEPRREQDVRRRKPRTRAPRRRAPLDVEAEAFSPADHERGQQHGTPRTFFVPST